MSDESILSLNIKNIRDDKTQRATVRLLASFIMEHGLVSIDQCLEQISDSDLFRINALDIESEDATEEDINEISMIAMLLNHAEGGTIGSETTYQKEALRLINSTIVMLTIEALARKGMIDVKRCNYTLDDSPAVASRPLAKITEAGKAWAREQGIGGEK